MYAKVSCPSIAPEKLLRAQLLQMLYSIRSERLLMEDERNGWQDHRVCHEQRVWRHACYSLQGGV